MEQIEAMYNAVHVSLHNLMLAQDELQVIGQRLRDAVEHETITDNQLNELPYYLGIANEIRADLDAVAANLDMLQFFLL